MVYKNVAPALASKGYRVLLYDLYGRGYSDAPQVTYDTALYATQLALLMQHVRWEKANIVGVSMVSQHLCCDRVHATPSPTMPATFPTYQMDTTQFSLPSFSRSHGHEANQFPKGRGDRCRSSRSFPSLSERENGTHRPSGIA